MEKKDWKKTKWKLNAIAVEYNLIERIDKIEEELEGLLDKAREEGIRYALSEVQERVGVQNEEVYVLCNAILQESLIFDNK